jgi:tetratricopeptide (TPR) repeat protein
MLHKKILIVFIFTCTQTIAQKEPSAFVRSMDSGYYYLNRFVPPLSMKHFGDAILEAKRLNNRHHYADALLGAGQATWYAGNFRNAADTVDLAIRFLPPNEIGEIISANRILSNIYDELGEYEKAFTTVQKALRLMREGVGENNIVLPLVQMGKLYKNIGDLESAMHYYRLALAEKPIPAEYPYRELHHCLGDLYVARHQFDSAAYFYRQSLKGNPKSKLIRLRLGELHLRLQNYDSAWYFVHPLHDEVVPTNDVNLILGTTIALAKIERARGDLRNAAEHAAYAYNLASQKGVYRYFQDASEVLALVNEQLGDAKAALRYHKVSDSLQTAASSDVYKGQLFAFRQKSEAATHAADLQALRDEKRIAQRTIIIVCLAAVLAIAIIVFRYQHIRLRLKQRASELEMQALRAQMNPHFIFNCLSAINHFILDNQNDKASDYLTRFSRLVRMVLANAGKDAIPLDEELDMLRLYLDMEQLRFKQAFTYTIDIPAAVPVSQLQVPCFILQPFCENAIWHGLLHKEGNGHLDVLMDYFDGKLRVTIRDNGVGRAKAAELSKKQYSSMGQQLTASRLALFNGNGNRNSSMHVRDVINSHGEVAGTQVTLTIQTPDSK